MRGRSGRCAWPRVVRTSRAWCAAAPTQPISENDVHALERAAAVAALLITREEAVTAVENKYQGDFLRDLFLRRAGDDQYVEEHADAFGWDLRRPVVVVVAELDPPRPGEDASGPQAAPVAGPVLGRVAPGHGHPREGGAERRLLLRGGDPAAGRGR